MRLKMFNHARSGVVPLVLGTFPGRLYFGKSDAARTDSAADETAAEALKRFCC